MGLAAPLGAAPAILSSVELEMMQFVEASHSNVWEKAFVLMQDYIILGKFLILPDK